MTRKVLIRCGGSCSWWCSGCKGSAPQPPPAQDVPQPRRPRQQAQRLVALWRTRIPLHTRAHVYPLHCTLCPGHSPWRLWQQSILLRCRERDVETASRTTTMASKMSTTWRTSTMGG
uniref:Uncharacterized protein n=1 Tax=Triticum urartu TaxID=4572 RepID=A0A8R7VC63_TRIUA